MKNTTQKTILIFVVSGLIYAGLGAGFDASEGIAFSLGKFCIKACVFGLCMSLFFRFAVKNNVISKNKD